MNFEAAVREFLDRNALLQLPKLPENEIAGKLAATFSELLRNSDARRNLGKNALDVMQKNRGATEKTIEYLKPFFADTSFGGANDL
jgi:3-deoxy-D-manno-octulosonic-acid transferase